MTPDPDPAVAAKAIHFRLDDGPEQTVATSGNPSTAQISLPSGSHALEYWGEDSVGGLENPHRTANTAGCSGPPLGTLPTRATLSSLFQTHPVFRVGMNSTPLLGRTTRTVPRGTLFSFRLDQPATVTLRIQRKTAFTAANTAGTSALRALSFRIVAG